ncbi:GNAT family N-acetyltransferase [Bacillus sp. CRN 9]|nr:GNAT family N-acetyltransferase [Bacillus sp. CRN 9]
MILVNVDDELVLRAIELQDSEKIFAIIDTSREYLREWLPWVDGTKSLKDSELFIEGCLKRIVENKGLTAVILYRNEIVGIAGFNEINWSNKTAYIGYWLDGAFQGMGIMSRVAKALTNYGLNQLGLNKIEIRAAVQNYKSRSIPERLSFKQEGIIRQAEWLYDHYVDLVVYGMLAEEWNK